MLEKLETRNAGAKCGENDFGIQMMADFDDSSVLSIQAHPEFDTATVSAIAAVIH